MHSRLFSCVQGCSLGVVILRTRRFAAHRWNTYRSILRIRPLVPVVAVVNRKGGSGKSTVATHLAAYFANSGIRVMLGDVDRQQSTQAWLKLRTAQQLAQRAAILGWVVDPKNVLRRPSGVTHVVLDTPGGMRGFDLARVVMFADAILMPVCNSVFDRDSAAECYAELKAIPRIASGRCKVAAVGMRLDARTKAGAVLKQWADRMELPFIGVLRETQAYVRCVERGLTLFDLPAAQVQADMAQWQPVLQWLDPVLQASQPAVDSAHRPSRAARAPGRPQTGSIKPLHESMPQSAPTQRKRVPSGVAGVPSRITLTTRIGRLLDSLPIPRFLQRRSAG